MAKSVIVIGCGIAGPVLAMLLKHKGFDPVIYERHTEIQNAGLILGVSPQTLKVLNILGLADGAIALGHQVQQLVTRSELTHEILGSRDVSPISQKLGWPMVLVVKRTRYCQYLYDSAVGRGIPVYFGKKVVGVEESGSGERVSAVFEDGTTAEGDLVVGCDGLHSAVRNALFGKEDPRYMGLVQIGGFSPIPESLRNDSKPTGFQIYGDGAHFIGMPVSSTEMVWATTLPEPTGAKEDWQRRSPEETREMIRQLPVSRWEGGVEEVIRETTFITRYGLYDRPVGDVWHKGRCVLVGDAAHPTSPHMGQGANQALEDCYHLVRLLCRSPNLHTSDRLTSSDLETALTQYEQLRVDIVRKTVAFAAEEGNRRVLSGKEACLARDEMLRNGGGSAPERAKLQMELIQGPFVGESEI
ncbi:FAD/NAD-P-binding domain-containing protein [Lentinula aff. lateritia]|uniref:FAD/NAD-P-binding domain-containing protein n=1 Tax=Lentinula aff. lateritia TaxID=2804960 RepID=A0ACC1U817_9AGAR|nr:FAD/NAD-P-binding domain-containing protein [Lentinula aff. lateritia]